MPDLSKSVYGYLIKQGDALRNILQHRKELTAKFVEVYSRVRPGRLYLVGSGTSRNACRAAAPIISGILHTEVSVIMPSRIPEIFCQNPMFLFLSQGGSSTNTLAAMEALKEYPYITMTGDAESEITRRSVNHMLIGCIEELAGPKTIGFTASIFNLTLCAIESAFKTGIADSSEYERVIGLLKSAVDNMDINIERTEKWFDANSASLIKIPKYVIIGHGAAVCAAQEGALKLMETVKVPVMAFDFEEYLHGPLLMTDENLAGIFYISEKPAVKRRMAELARIHALYSRFTYVITGSPGNGGTNELSLAVTGSEITEIYEYVLPPQMIAAKAPKLLGISDGHEIWDKYAAVWDTKFNDGK